MDWHNKGFFKFYISSFFNKTCSDYLLFLYCGVAGVLFNLRQVLMFPGTFSDGGLLVPAVGIASSLLNLGQ